MKHKYRLLFIMALSLLTWNPSQAQFYGVPGRSTAAIFLPGHYLELGVNANGAFGAADSSTGEVPFSGYYPYVSTFSPSGPLAEVYDYGHDGWTVGTPAYYGDYTWPGSPFEGWELQVGGAGNIGQAYTTSYSFNTIALSGSSTLNGGLTSYVNAGGQLVANWAGTESGGNLLVNMSAEIDTNGNTYNCVVTLKNIGATPITGVYYMRSCDPDNDEAHGGSFATNNTIVHQNENASHDVEVDAEGTLYDDHWSICTKDCRATAFVYTSWPLSSTVDLAGVSAETSDCSGFFGGDTAYALGSTLDGDYAIGVVFNIGTIAAGDSAVLAYAYVFNDAYSTIDVAFPQPEISVGGYVAVDDSLPNPTIDTFNACSFTDSTGLTSVPVNILYGSSGTWTYSTWTWSPATGLAATTGVNNTVNLTAIPATMTYTVTGVNPVGGPSCDSQVFILTIKSCTELYANNPCTGDTLQFHSTGDSIGATYSWTGPGGFTSTKQNPYIYPATIADDGWYYLNRTIAGVDSLDSTYATVRTCLELTVNSPCVGDSLIFTNTSDSTDATYAWTGPDGFTSSLQTPVIYPASLANAGWYYLTWTFDGVPVHDSVFATVHYIPTVTATTNAPICVNGGLTLHLYSSPDSTGESFAWTGPDSFASTLQNPSRDSFATADTGTYKIVVTVSGCSDSAYVYAGTVAPPTPPVLSDPSPYCQYAAFTPISVTGIDSGATVYWFPTSAGGTSSTVTPTVNTSVPGTRTFFAQQVVAGCPSIIDSIAIQVISKAPTPTVTGQLVYCQYDSTFNPVTVNLATGGIALWYTADTGGAPMSVEPGVDLDSPATYYSYVSQTIVDSNCESNRQPVAITVNPKPVPPTVVPQAYCQFATAGPARAYSSGAALDSLWWSGPGIAAGGSYTAPTPSTDVPGTVDYYVKQGITTLGKTCYSDSIVDAINIIPLPAPPVTADLKYCQFSTALPLTAIGSSLRWYQLGLTIDSTPVPPTNMTGPETWYVTQSITSSGLTCESDSAALTVTIIYQPDFTINASSFVCQYDSISLSYNSDSNSLAYPSYTWVLPEGAVYANGTNSGMADIQATFDTANIFNYVYLTVSDDSGFCTTTDSLNIHVVPQPAAMPYTKTPVCMGDTTTLGLSSESNNAYNFNWYIDGTPLTTSPEVNIIAGNSNSGGPYSIVWLDSGSHIIQLNTFTQEQCASNPFYDTVDVHAAPDAAFTYEPKPGSSGICLDDSIYFAAVAFNGSYLYTWTPEHAFNNVNSPSTWGKVEQDSSTVTLTVTNPYGCSATAQQTIDASSCCTVLFPNAFTPGNTINNRFRPIFTGYHNFHDFRITNRWGQLIFESTNNTVEWDGNYNGVPQDMGVYFYYVKYDCGGNTLEAKGDVTLVR